MSKRVKGSINDPKAKTSAANTQVSKKGGIAKNQPTGMVIHDAHAEPPPGMRHAPGSRGGKSGGY